MTDRFDFNLELVELNAKICERLQSYKLFCFVWETCELLDAYKKLQPTNECDLVQKKTLKKKYLVVACKYFDQSFGSQIQSMFFTPKPITCRECGGDIAIDHINNNDEYYCDECGVILGYDIEDFTVENIRGKYNQRGAYKKPKPPKTKKVLAELGIQTTGCVMLTIEYKLKQILRGKISRGQVFRSLVAVCYLNVCSTETPERVRELFQTSPKHFNRAMERYNQTFLEEER